MSYDRTAAEGLVSVTDLVDGIPIHARVSPHFVVGRTPLVFVHGLGVSVRYLEPTMSLLVAEHHVAGLDLPGFGRSGTPPEALDTRGLASALAACSTCGVSGRPFSSATRTAAR